MAVKNNGKKFEEEFIDSLSKYVYRHRIADPPQSWGNASNLRFSNKNPFDFFIYDEENLYCLELKTGSGKSFSFPTIHEIEDIDSIKEARTQAGRSNKKEYDLHDSNLKKAKSKLASRNIKNHQIDGLKEAKDCGCKSFFIFNFNDEKENNLTLAIDIDDFISIRNTTDKKSINKDELLELVNNKTSFIIPNMKKSTRKNTKKMIYNLTSFGVKDSQLEDTFNERQADSN